MMSLDDVWVAAGHGGMMVRARLIGSHICGRYCDASRAKPPRACTAKSAPAEGIWETAQLCAPATDNFRMPAFVQEQDSPTPLLQCPLCEATGVIGDVRAPDENHGALMFHPWCQTCGYREDGVLFELDDGDRLCAASPLFSRWLHPTRRLVWVSPLASSPRRSTCAVCDCTRAGDEQWCRFCCATRGFASEMVN